MRILIYLSHPAQFHFFRHTVNILKGKGHLIYTLTKTKDVLSHLLDAEGWEYHNILPKVRGKSRFSIIWSLILRDLKILSFARRNKIELLMGSDSSLSHVGKLLNIPCVTTLEDDYEVIRNLARLTYPFTSHILVPDVCDVGKWKSKKIGYPAYMKLAYLHPRYFIPDRSKAGVDTNIPFFLLRLSGLSAHHDFGIEGINMDLLHKIIALIGTKGKIFISSEETLPVFFKSISLRFPFLIFITPFHLQLFWSVTARVWLWKLPCWVYQESGSAVSPEGSACWKNWKRNISSPMDFNRIRKMKFLERLLNF